MSLNKSRDRFGSQQRHIARSNDNAAIRAYCVSCRLQCVRRPEWFLLNRNNDFTFASGGTEHGVQFWRLCHR